MSELLPLFPLSTVLFPGMRLPLHIFEERYRILAAELRERPEAERRVGGIATPRVQEGFRGYLNALAARGGGVISITDLPDEPLLLSYVVGAAMIIDLPERQSLLAAPSALDRLRLERSLLVRETGMLRATTSRPAPDYTFGQFS